MISIIPHIQYLICHNDCVVLPGFGALIAHRVGARIEEGTLYPPSRTLGFNPSVCHNDAALASSVSRKEGISYPAAVVAVNSSIEELRRIYDVAGMMTIPRVGSFVRTDEGVMEFVPDTVNPIASYSYFGLPEISLAPKAENAESTPAILPARYLSPFNRALRIAASIVILIVLGVTLSTPVMIDRNSHDFASLSLPEVTSARAVVLPELPAADNAEIIIPVPDVEEATVTVDSESLISTEPNGVRMNPSDRYFLVVASYETASQARKYMAEHPGENLAILEAGGRCRVYAATGTSVEEARSLMDNSEFRAVHPDGWVYKN